MTIFERIGVPVIINAKGTGTRLSGALMDREVADAMAEAADYCVDIAELQAAASRTIAHVTGAEAGYVTSGAAAGLLLATAACVAGLNPSHMGRLPDTSGMRDEVIMVRGQRNFYDHAVRTAGVKIIEVGLPDRHAGAGVRDTETWEIADAITEKTAAIFYVAERYARPPLTEVTAVAHAAGIPVIVDAAAQLPPAANLKRFISEGADLVAFSGGKVIGGPQATGLLCGRQDLIMSVALQHLDMDFHEEQWQPPATLIDKTRLKGMPRNGIGRPCKVGREDIVGFLTALDRFVSESDAARHKKWLAKVEMIASDLKGLNGAALDLVGADDTDTVPLLQLTLPPSPAPSALDVMIALQNGTPSVHVDATYADRRLIHINPIGLREDQVALVAPAIRTALG